MSPSSLPPTKVPRFRTAGRAAIAIRGSGSSLGLGRFPSVNLGVSRGILCPSELFRAEPLIRHVFTFMIFRYLPHLLVRCWYFIFPRTQPMSDAKASATDILSIAICSQCLQPFAPSAARDVRHAVPCGHMFARTAWAGSRPSRNPTSRSAAEPAESEYSPLYPSSRRRGWLSARSASRPSGRACSPIKATSGTARLQPARSATRTQTRASRTSRHISARPAETGSTTARLSLPRIP